MSLFPVNSWSLPNIGVDANTLPEGVLFARQRFFYVDYTARYDEKLNKYIDFEKGESFTSRWRLTEIAYGINDSTTIVGNLWYYQSALNTKELKSKDSGIGDTYFFLKNKLMTFDDKNSGLSFLTGIRFPTGDFDDEPELRMGDGSTDFGLGLSATIVSGNFNHSIVAAIWKNIDRKRNGNDKDEFELRTTSEWQILPKKFSFQMELKALVEDGNKEYTYEFAPGIQYTPVFPLTFQLSAKIPFAQKGYYKYDNQIVFGVSFGLPIK